MAQRRPPSSLAGEGPVGPPPEGSPWDSPCAEVPWLFLDLEMTGLDPTRDRVLEVCAQRVRGGSVEASLVSLVRPDGDVHGASEIHGILAADLEGAPSFVDLLPRLRPLLDGAILVAHAAEWDVAFLEAELVRAGVPRRFPHVIDTLVLARRAMLAPSYALQALCKELGIEAGRAHRAEDDVRSLRLLFEHLLGLLSPETPRDLWNVRVGKRFARPDLLAKVDEALASQLPVKLRYRASHKAPEELSFRVTSLRRDLDPPHVLGYQLDSRSRRELRADRILAIEALPPEASSGPASKRARR